MNIKKYLNVARQEAKKGSVSDWHIGAVIVRGGKIISRGHNKNSGKIRKFEQLLNISLFSLHAEMSAILNCNESVEDTIMFIAGNKKNGHKMYCRPCKHCLKIIKHMKFKAVYYETKTNVEAIIF